MSLFVYPHSRQKITGAQWLSLFKKSCPCQSWQETLLSTEAVKAHHHHHIPLPRHLDTPATKMSHYLLPLSPHRAFKHQALINICILHIQPADSRTVWAMLLLLAVQAADCCCASNCTSEKSADHENQVNIKTWPTVSGVKVDENHMLDGCWECEKTADWVWLLVNYQDVPLV